MSPPNASEGRPPRSTRAESTDRLSRKYGKVRAVLTPETTSAPVPRGARQRAKCCVDAGCQAHPLCSGGRRLLLCLGRLGRAVLLGLEPLRLGRLLVGLAAHQELLGDHEALDLRGALVELHDLR